MAYEAYCVKCRRKVKMENGKEVTTANGRRAAKGTCPNCGTTVYRFLPNA